MATVELLKRLCEGRSGRAPLIALPDGTRLPEKFQRYPMARAMKAADLGEGSIYAVRRGAISWAVTAGGVDVLTVAQMADVDPRLILKHYFKRSEKLGTGPDLAGAAVVSIAAE